MVTRFSSSTSFWRKLKSGPWGKAVAERIETALDNLVRTLRVDDSVVAIVVFGSYARGDFSRKSDLDLLILIQTASAAERAEAERRVASAVIDTETIGRLPVHLAPLILDVGSPEGLDSAFLHEVWTDGVVLYAELTALAGLQPTGLAPWDVVRFSLQGTLPRERVRLARRLHGTQGKPGIIRLPGIDLARGAALVPAEQGRAVRDALDEAGASYDLIPVWRDISA
jgi:predicted nucleotidyltransferase